MKHVIIYQLKTECLKTIGFLDYDMLKSPISMANYDIVYDTQWLEQSDDVMKNLDKIFSTFNINIPKDFHGRSLSVSDIIEYDGIRYYVDGIGFVKLS